MGNDQSVESPRRAPNRLSKPRMNSSTILLNAKPAENLSRQNSNEDLRRYSTVSFVDVVGDESETPDLGQKKRRSMFRSRSVQPTSKPLDLDEGEEINYSTPDQSDNWSTRGTFTKDIHVQSQYAVESRPMSRPARISLQHVPYAQQYAQQSPVIDPYTTRAVRRNTYVQNEREAVWKSHIQEAGNLPNENGPTEQPYTEAELFLPIRRRSMEQHGIATRINWVEDELRQSSSLHLPPETTRSELLNPDHNRSRPTSSRLTNFTATAPKPEQVTRTMTPDNKNYGHTGVYKLGSLRVTNGAISPSPSFDMPAIKNGGYSSQGKPEIHHTLIPSSIAAPSQGFVKPPPLLRTNSPLQQTLQHGETQLRVNTHLPPGEFSAFNFNPEASQRSSDLSYTQQQDLVRSPFSFEDSPRTPRLESTSKHTAIEDDLFVAEIQSPAMKARLSQSFDSGYEADGPQVRNAVQGPANFSPKTLAKADSGYSSNASIESTGSFAPTESSLSARKASTQSRDSILKDVSSVHSAASSCCGFIDNPIKSNRSQPALSADEASQPNRQLPRIPLKGSGPQDSGKSDSPRAQLKSPERDQYAKQHNVSTIIQTSLPSSSPSAGLESPATTSRWWKEKRQQPTESPTLYTVQADRSDSMSSIPPVSAEQSRRLEERVDSFSVTNFPNTLAGTNKLRKPASKETLGTILSVGSAEHKEERSTVRLQETNSTTPKHHIVPSTAEIRCSSQPSSTPSTPNIVSNRQSFHSNQRNSTAIQRQSSQDFEILVTTEDASSVYSTANTSRSNSRERTKSMTSQHEGSARARLSQFISRRTSRESLSKPTTQPSTYTDATTQTPNTGSPDDGPLSEKVGSLSTLGRYPNQNSINNIPTPRPRSSINILADDERRLSTPNLDRLKSPPPVSMRTRKSNPNMRKSRTPSPAKPQLRPDPQPEPQSRPQSARQDASARPKSFFAPRQQTADEPSQTLEPKSDSRRSLMQGSSMSGDQSQGKKDRPDPAAARKSLSTWDLKQPPHNPNQELNPNHIDPLRQHPPSPNRNHTRSATTNQINHNIQPITRPSTSKHTSYIAYSQPNHQVRPSTSSQMLVLDRFSGGFDYGYEPGAGLGGSAGMRNTGDMAEGERKGVDFRARFGVDFGDVPIFVRRATAGEVGL